jgi:hypothetical protein
MFSIWSREARDQTSAQAELLRSNSVKFWALNWFTINILCPCLATIQQKVYLNTGSCKEQGKERHPYTVLSAYGSVCVSQIAGWPLLTVETEVKRDSKRSNKRGPFLVGSLGLPCRYKRFLFCLGCSWSAQYKYFFPHRTLFQFLCPHCPASWPGSHGWVAYLF